MTFGDLSFAPTESAKRNKDGTRKRQTANDDSEKEVEFCISIIFWPIGRWAQAKELQPSALILKKFQYCMMLYIQDG
tara:strand:+ start:40 stop:270 length:231 start_codon:yes stop_codon:yes gene_type:complete